MTTQQHVDAGGTVVYLPEHPTPLHPRSLALATHWSRPQRLGYTLAMVTTFTTVRILSVLPDQAVMEHL